MVVGEFAQDADVVIIGGGPAGYACAFDLADAGRDVIIVDTRESLGGACLHDACIPTKTALHAAETAAATGHSMLGDAATVDPTAMDAWTSRTVRRLGAGLDAGASQRKVQVIKGTARFLSSREVQVAGDEVARYRFKRAVIATGSTASLHPCAIDDPRWCPPDTMLHDPTRCSQEVVVIGHDANALESAAICTGLGGTVHLLTDGQTPLPGVPRALVEPLTSHVRMIDGPIASASASDDVVTIHAGDHEFQASLVVDCSSRTPAIGELGLDATDVKIDSGCIVTDDRMATNDPRIFAIGDCVGPPYWAGVAMQQGRIGAESICGGAAAWDPAAVPQVIFGPTGMCWCGSEQDAESIVVPWTYSGLAVTMKAHDGCTVLCWDKDSGVITGCGAVGAGATELATACTIAVEMGATLQDLADMVPAHPTRGELLFDAARDALSRA